MNKQEIEYKISELERKIHIFEDSKESMENAISDYKEELEKLKQELNKVEEWTPEYDDIYWYYDKDRGEIDFCRWADEEIDSIRLKNKVIFKTEAEAQRYADYQKAKEEYSYKFSKEEWEDGDSPKSYIYYDYEDKTIRMSSSYIYKYLGILYFKTKDQAQEFIDKYKAEILEFEFGIKED